MWKVYVSGVEDKTALGYRTPVEVSFSFHSEDAYSWPSKEQAQNSCAIFDSYDIVVSWAEGGHFPCKEFRVEERSPREFVIFCKGPFTLKATGSKSSRLAS
jgi:hypothetical protein